jgi:hypothetical protein
MPFDLLLLPLLGGFIFVSRWYPTRYYTLRTDGYRLIFASALAGVLLLFTVVLLREWAEPYPQTAALFDFWHGLVRIEDAALPAGAFILGAVAWMPLNLIGRYVRLLSESRAVDRAIRRKQDPLELILRKALGTGTLVSVTMKNEKVYIGKVIRNFNPAFPMESVALLLARSGYRDKATRELHLTTDYDRTHQKIREAW